jgi:hypothetical protein
MQADKRRDSGIVTGIVNGNDKLCEADEATPGSPLLTSVSDYQQDKIQRARVSNLRFTVLSLMYVPLSDD